MLDFSPERRRFLARLTLPILCVFIGGVALAKDFCTGEITKVNVQSHTLTISTQSDCCGGRMIELDFTMAEKTKITLDGTEAKLADLKTGDRVDIEYEDLDQVKSVSAHRDK